MHTKFLILGAGPSGLAFACRLFRNGIRDFLVLESQYEAGGLCRSVQVDGSDLDIGGGHILDVRRPGVVQFLFQYMPRDEWNYFIRDTTIHINGQYISHPLEANIWQFGLEEQVQYLKSIAQAGSVRGTPKPEKFTDWITWKLGEKIAHDYMIPYNTKMFGEALDDLGTYWLEKLPSVSFEDTLLSCLEHKAHAVQPGHAEYYYPIEHGYGELWLRMAASLEGRILYGQKVNAIDFEAHTVRTQDNEYHGDIIINTVPYREFRDMNGLPEDLREKIRELRHTSVQVKYIPQNMNTSAQWIYYPDMNLSYHRIFLRHNVLLGSKGVWLETRKERIDPPDEKFAYMNEYSYPLNTIEKPEIMKSLLEWLASRQVYGLGRWGEHQHYNSDLCVELGIKLADRFSA